MRMLELSSCFRCACLTACESRNSYGSVQVSLGGVASTVGSKQRQDSRRGYQGTNCFLPSTYSAPCDFLRLVSNCINTLDFPSLVRPSFGWLDNLLSTRLATPGGNCRTVHVNNEQSFQAIHFQPLPFPSTHRTPMQHAVAPIRRAPSQYAILA